MKNLLFLLLLIPICGNAQRDFDYTFYTRNSTQIKGSDTLELSLFRKFEKESNILKAVSTTNTGDTNEYKLEFLGVSYVDSCPTLMYQVVSVNGELVAERMMAIVNPIEPAVIFSQDTLFCLFH